MSIFKNQGFVLDIPYDVNTAAVQVFQDGVQVQELPVPTPGARGTLTFPFPKGLPEARAYEFTATASNVEGVSDKSAPMDLPVEGVPVPLPPGPITYRVTGTLTLTPIDATATA